MLGSSSHCTTRPVRVVVLEIRLTMVWYVVSGRPRQLTVIRENSRCSILFHLLVPGVYDLADDSAWVSVGGDHATSVFAVATIEVAWSTPTDAHALSSARSYTP